MDDSRANDDCLNDDDDAIEYDVRSLDRLHAILCCSPSVESSCTDDAVDSIGQLDLMMSSVID